MNHMLPMLSVAFCLLLPPEPTSGQSPQVLSDKGVAPYLPALDSAPPPPGDQAIASGQELVAQAARRLLLAPGIEAKTRQRVSIFDQELVGSGTYLQLTQGSKLLLQLDLKLQVGTAGSTLRQISDGNIFWVVRRQGEQTDVSRVRLHRLREVAAEYEQAHVILPPSLWMALGGIPRLLSQLEQSFLFQAPKPILIGKFPVWSLEGKWKPEVLATFLPAQKETILAGGAVDFDALPAHIPHGVNVILGRDEIIPLFPYSFSFYRQVSAPDGSDRPRRLPIVTWELFEVRVRPDLQPAQFEFRPTDQEVRERTGEYVAHLHEAAAAMQTSRSP